MTIIKQLKNSRIVIFDTGKFDKWCVYIVEADGSRKAPFDIDYFTDLKSMSKDYINDKIYNDFVSIYKLTNKTIDKNTIVLIDKIVSSYKLEHQIIIEQCFTVLYAGMIAEENKKFAILKKRIKRLGMHQILIDDLSPFIAANFSKGKKWRQLDALMKTKGF